MTTSASPSFDDSGHRAGSVECSAISPSGLPGSGVFVHAPSPFAADSEIAIPGGSITVSCFRSASASPSMLSSCGSVRSTFSPVGDSAVATSGAGCTFRVGVNARLSQPVTGGEDEVAVFQRGSLRSGVPSGFRVPGSCQESTLIVVVSVSPVQVPGMVSSGAPVPSVGQLNPYSFVLLPFLLFSFSHSSSSIAFATFPLAAHTPRCASWLGEDGLPQRVSCKP